MKSNNFTGNIIEKFNIAIFATVRKWYETCFFLYYSISKTVPFSFQSHQEKEAGNKKKKGRNVKKI